MYKLICENDNEEGKTFTYLFKNNKQIKNKFFEQSDFNLESINKTIKNINDNELITIEINVDNKDNLLNIIEIINNSTNLIFKLDFSKVSIEHKDMIKIINNNISDDKLNIIQIKYQESSKEIPYYEYRKMYYRLYEIIDEIKNLNLSPMEEVMYVYDIIKGNIYKKDEKNSGLSRNLHDVINNDYIVCVGYSNYMEFILKELGHNIFSESFKYDNSDKGHRRNAIHLIDEKYNIDNLLFLDATADSKKNNDDEEYLDNYFAFLKPYRIFNIMKKNEHFRDDFHYSILEYNKELITEIINNNNLYIGNEKNHNLILHSLRTVLNIKKDTGLEVTKALGLKDNQKLLEYYNEMYEFCNKIITPEIFLECLFNVRKIQYENEIISKIPNIDEIERTMIKNYGKNYLIDERCIKLLDILFGKRNVTNRILLEDKIQLLISKNKTYKKSK